MMCTKKYPLFIQDQSLKKSCYTVGVCASWFPVIYELMGPLGSKVLASFSMEYLSGTWVKAANPSLPTSDTPLQKTVG